MAPLSMSVLAGPIAGHRVEAARLADRVARIIGLCAARAARVAIPRDRE
jgi:hypothetical protein